MPRKTIIIITIVILVIIASSALLLLGPKKEEMLEISATARSGSTPSGHPMYRITLTIKNIGEIDATILPFSDPKWFLDGKAFSEYVQGTTPLVNATGLGFSIGAGGYPVEVGGTRIVYIDVLAGGTFTHGKTIEIKVVTKSGKEYKTTVTLP
jgi:hypothetical protein